MARTKRRAIGSSRLTDNVAAMGTPADALVTAIDDLELMENYESEVTQEHVDMPGDEGEQDPSPDIDICYEYGQDMEVEYETSPQRPPAFEALKAIEKRTKKTIVLETNETDAILTRCYSQEQSPLFTELPREIRDMIWKFATAPHEDDQNRYEENKFYYRPGHTAPLKTDYAILLTCRRAWLEANAYPMLQAEQCYWYHRQGPDMRGTEWMNGLTVSNRQNLGHLHIFPQMFAIEGLANRPTSRPLRSHFPEWRVRIGEFQPRMFHVTVRHTDWWYWESDTPLRFEDSWFKVLLDTEELRSTQVLKLELETLDYKADQLMPIVERLSRLESRESETHIVDGIPTTTRFILQGDPEVQTWRGPSNIDGQVHRPYRGRDTLDYHIVTLTWRLHFPEYPHAHIPTLRRAPRVGLSEDTSGSLNPVIAAIGEGRAENDFPRMPQFEQHHHYNLLSRRSRRLRSRAIRRGMVGSEDSGSGMMNASIYAQRMQEYQSKVDERIRKAIFDQQMGIMHERQWRQKWEAEGSLLKFED